MDPTCAGVDQAAAHDGHRRRSQLVSVGTQEKEFLFASSNTIITLRTQELLAKSNQGGPSRDPAAFGRQEQLGTRL